MKMKFLKVLSWFKAIFPIILSFIVKLRIRIGKRNDEITHSQERGDYSNDK